MFSTSTNAACIHGAYTIQMTYIGVHRSRHSQIWSPGTGGQMSADRKKQGIQANRLDCGRKELGEPRHARLGYRLKEARLSGWVAPEEQGPRSARLVTDPPAIWLGLRGERTGTPPTEARSPRPA